MSRPAMTRRRKAVIFAAHCSVEGCENPIHVKSSGLCNRHYLRLRRNGDALAQRPKGSHQLSQTPEYRAWINMKTRCNDETTPYYSIWGGRGITVCARWMESFQNFYEDMGKRPSPKHSLDRINVNGNYEPSNCRWATRSTQMRNVRVNHHVEVGGVSMTLADAVEGTGLDYNTVLYRLKRGWPLEHALTAERRKGVRPWLV